MKLLHIMASRGLGGAETTSADVMLSLHAAGVDQCVVIAKNAPRYDELKDAGIRLVPEILAPPFRFMQRKRLRALIEREQPDIIHCWMRRAASLLSETIYQDVRSDSSPSGGRLGGGSDKANPPPAKTKDLLKKQVQVFASSPQGVRTTPVIGWFGGYYDVRQFKQCTHFVGVTKGIVAHQVKSGVDAARAFFVPTFPDIRDMQPADRAAFRTPRHAKVLLTLSRLHPKKGLDTLLAALQTMPDCVAWLAGDGPLLRDLEKLAAKLGVQDRVRFLGWRTDRAALLRAADVCVLPSRYEPFGTVILEAWAAGTPLVACASAGPAAHVADGVNGLLAPIDDAPGLAKAMQRVLDDGNLRRQLIAEGHAAYMKDYTRDAVMQKWRQLYEHLMTEAA